MKYVDEVIGNDYRNWDENTVALIVVQVGKGKTRWVVKVLLPYCRQKHIHINYFCNRNILKLQLKKILARELGIEYQSLDELDSITDFYGISVYTYQEVEKNISRFQKNLLPGFNVCDECHYFEEDATFNSSTFKSWDFIKKQMSHSGTIFMSATMNEMIPLIEDAAYTTPTSDSWPPDFMVKKDINIFEYRMPEDYSYLDIIYYEDESQIIDAINNTDPGEKWLVYISNLIKAQEKYEVIIQQECCSVISALQKEGHEMNEIISNYKFLCRILFTTKVLDNGVSLIDPALKYIVLDTVSEIEAKQMVGRKRITYPEERVTVFIKKRKINDFQGIIRYAVAPAQKAFATYRRDKEKFFQMFIHDPSTRDVCLKHFEFHYGHIEMNYLSEIKINTIAEFCKEMIERFKAGYHDAFIMEQLSWFGKEAEFSPHNYLSYPVEEKARENLLIFLENQLGCLTEKTEFFRSELQEMILIAYPEHNVRASRVIGWSKINDFFMEFGLPYEITYQKKGDKRYQFLSRRSR